VTKAGYDACSGGSNAVKSYTGTSATVKLSAPGKRYFICSVPGHCAAGMKLEVTVTAPAPSSKSKPRHQRSVAPTPAPAPATDGELPNVASPDAAPSPKSSDAATIAMLGGKAVVGLAVAVAAALAM